MAYISIFVFMLLGFLPPLQAEESLLWQNASKVLEKRCVACHSCSTAPCQINLSSYEGVLRGGKDEPVYDGNRLTPQTPTRLYIDGKTEKDWRHLHDFYPIVGSKGQGELFFRALALGQSMKKFAKKRAFSPGETQCPNESEWDAYVEDYADQGMPYGFPPLTAEEFGALAAWSQAGYPGELQTDSQLLHQRSPGALELVGQMERYFNQAGIKNQIVSRYLYEHLFLAHIVFKGYPGEFFQLVRSKSAYPYEIDEVATVRPYDHPKTGYFYYRLRPLRSAPTYKNHILFEWDESVQAKLSDSLNKGQWVKEPKTLPSYKVEVASNPFLAFQDMPLRGRYQFFLDHAHYFVMTFIRGPVCEGQVAVNVIHDHFFTLFMDPDADLSMLDPNYLLEAGKFLELPAQGESSPIESYYKTFLKQHEKYVKFRAKRYAASNLRSQSFNVVWDGGAEKDPDAALTIFRHFDNSSVIHGLWGAPAQTVWLIDYPIFERIYYLLVAGFDVFGNVFHQASTRLYMDSLRREAENNFIYLAPPQVRDQIRASWYQGKGMKDLLKEEVGALVGPSYLSSEDDYHLSGVDWVSDAERRLRSGRLQGVVNQEDPLNCCSGDIKDRTVVERALYQITLPITSFARFMPEITMILVEGETAAKPELIFLSRFSAHSNVAFLFDEDERRLPDRDRLIATRDWVGSYPNLLIKLSPAQLLEWADKLTKARSQAEVDALLKEYGATRDKADFWQTFDRFHEVLAATFPAEFGLLDLSKYSNLTQKH